MSQTVASKIGNVMPAGIRDFLKPLYHELRETWTLLIKLKGRLYRDTDTGSWIATRPFAGRQMPAAVRSYKEFRRFIQFGNNKRDIVHKWLENISNCACLYDVGAANGLEGFLCHHLHGSKICFVEPYTPSIETIMKTTYVLTAKGVDPAKFEIVHAGCGAASGYDRAYMLCPPKAGETQISFSDPSQYERRGMDMKPVITQWVAGITLDDLHFKHGLEYPSHVKIDVDGYEHMVMRGCTKILEKGEVLSWAIEINSEKNMEMIQTLMKKYGYIEKDRWEHYPGTNAGSFDVIFERE